MTVGELVERKWLHYVKKNDMIVLNEHHVPEMNAVEILRDLGIWDAEVQWAQWEGEGYTDYDLLQVWGDERPTRPSQEPGAFRIIVLPTKGSE